MDRLHKIINFIKYHNAFTIIVVAVFSAFGASYAASPTIRDSIYSTQESVVSVDNSLLLSTDLDNFNFNLKINSVTEDDTYYYADYSYQTLAIEDGSWQNVPEEKVLKVSKETLTGKDLGLYVSDQLGENINSELAYLKKVQNAEKESGESQKVVAVIYSGLIGKLLNPQGKVIEGYNPVIEPTPTVSATEAPTPEITLTPEITPTPAATSTPEPTVSQPVSTSQPEITESPTATPSEETTPESTPEPTLQPTPEPTLSPTPEPTLSVQETPAEIASPSATEIIPSQ